jgi:hypothetical protein
MQPRVMATTSSRQNLDTINFFVAAVQTGFGPFIDVILTEHGWTETDIGFVLSVGTFAGIVKLTPAGAWRRSWLDDTRAQFVSSPSLPS